MATISPGWVILLSCLSCFISNTLGQTFCQSSWCLEGSECIFIEPNSRCECISGYSNGSWNLTANSFTCSDYDECVSGNNQCVTNATCENTKGSYRCTCPQGRKLLQDPINNQHCIGLGTEICESSISVCGNGTRCTSTSTGTSYACSCLPGYTGQNYSLSTFNIQCYDINECTAEADICGQFASCINQIGSYMCQCDQEVKTWSGPLDTKACSNADICQTEFHICGRGSNCVSNLGSGRYDCTCREGYAGLTYNTASKTIQCADKDECSSANLNKCDRKLSTCVNSEGSYRCECITGYYNVEGNTRACEDVDECLNTTRVCPESTLCVNTPGAYRCPCEDGFVLSSSGNGCESQSNVELAVGLSVSAVMSLVIIGLLIIWCTRDRFKKSKPPEKDINRSEQDLASLSGRSEQSSFAMTPSALLSVSSRSGSVRFQKLQANGIMKAAQTNGVYQVHPVTERMVRSYRRKKLAQQSQASSYVSRKSSMVSEMSKPSYFDTRSNGLAAINGSDEMFDPKETQSSVNGKGKGIKGGKVKTNPGGLTISANKLPEDVVVMVETSIVSREENVFSADDEIPPQDDALRERSAQPPVNYENSTESVPLIGQVPSLVITEAEIEPIASSLSESNASIRLPEIIVKKDGSIRAQSPTRSNNDTLQPMSNPDSPVLLHRSDEDIYAHVKPRSERLNEHNQEGIIPRLKSFRSALQSQGEPEISQSVSEDRQEEKPIFNMNYASDDD